MDREMYTRMSHVYVYNMLYILIIIIIIFLYNISLCIAFSTLLFVYIFQEVLSSILYLLRLSIEGFSSELK